MMDVKQLATFERIVREGTFGRAAQALGLSQATVSGRIQALEAELGAALFERGARSGRRVLLTGAGETFLPFARRALAILSEGADAARQQHTGQYGRVTVGAIDSVVDGLLVPAVTRYRAAHPHVVLSIRTGHTPQIVQEILDGTVRLGLVTWGYVRGSVGLTVLLRVREPLVAVAAPGHPLVRRTRISVDDLIRDADPYHDTAWGTPEDARIAGAAQRSWPDHELPHALIRQLIASGLGAGFLPRSVAAPDIASGRLIPLPVSDATGIIRDVALICTDTEQALPPATRDFVEAIRAETMRGTL